MARPLLLLVVSTFSCISSAQVADTAAQRFKNEIGLEATYFVRQFLNIGNASDPYISYYAPTYLLTFKHDLGHCRLRIGLGGSLTARTDTGGYNSNTNHSDRSWSIDARFGVEKEKYLSRKWSAYYGVDLLCGYERGVQHNLSTWIGTPDWKTETTALGGGPVLGIEFHMTQRLSLATESSIYLCWSRRTEDFDYADSPNDNREAYTELGQISIAPPTQLFFIWHF